MEKSLYEFGQTILQIREAIDSIEVKGRKNASCIVFASNKCDDLINALNAACKDAKKEMDGDSNEQHSGLPK